MELFNSNENSLGLFINQFALCFFFKSYLSFFPASRDNTSASHRHHVVFCILKMNHKSVAKIYTSATSGVKMTATTMMGTNVLSHHTHTHTEKEVCIENRKRETPTTLINERQNCFRRKAILKMTTKERRRFFK